jgi:Uncharacterized protein conserved in bacteria
MARKVVGVGSVGTRAWILLFEGLNTGDPLFLQAKEAQSSVLEQYLGVSEYTNHGQRVVVGQRLMQAASDIFLGWQRTNGLDGVDRDYYVRQLRDWKGSFEVEGSRPDGAVIYARVCGWTLARAHARAGDRVAIASYRAATTPSTRPSPTSPPPTPTRTTATTRRYAPQSTPAASRHTKANDPRSPLVGCPPTRRVGDHRWQRRQNAI